VPSPWAQAANNDEIRSGFVRIVDGLPDHAHRLGGLGNAIIPEFAELIGNAILQSISGRTESARHFDPAPRELVGTVSPWAVPAFFDDAELSDDLPEYTPGGFPNADQLARSGGHSFHSETDSREAQHDHA
jgi:hypothetical protein